MGEFAEHLQAMGDIWKQGKDQPPGVPDGDYRMQLLDCKLATSKAGNLMVKRQFVVLDGEYEGTQVNDNMVLASEQNMYYFARWVDVMGYNVPDNAEDIEDVLTAISEENAVVVGRVKRSGDFQNVTVTERVGTEEAKPAKATKKSEPKSTPKKAPAKSEPEPEPEAETANTGEWKEGDKVSFDDGEGNTITGDITGFEGDSVIVKDSEGAAWTAAPEDLTRVKASTAKKAPAKSAPAKSAPAKAKEDNSDLVAFAVANGVDGDLKDGMTRKQVIAALAEYKWDANNLTPDEVALLDANGIEYIKAKKATATKKK